jgi:hypothetical protein
MLLEWYPAQIFTAKDIVFGLSVAQVQIYESVGKPAPWIDYMLLVI